MRIATVACAALLALGVLSPVVRAQTASETTGVTDTAIKIGVFGPLTGPAAAFGKALLGVVAYYKYVNEHGGINGRKIELSQEDDACNPAQGIAVVKKLISEDRVFAIQGGSCSNVVMAVEPQIVAAKIPYLVISAASSQITTPINPNVFQALPNTRVVAQAMVDFAMSRPHTTRIALISQSDEWGKSNHDPAIAYLKSKYHLAPVADVIMNHGATDATPQILRLRAAHPDFIIAVLYPAPLAIFERDAYKYGLQTSVVTNQAISIEDTRNQVGTLAAINNLYVYYPLLAPVDDPAMARWRSIALHTYPNVRLESSSFLGMGGAIALVDAMRACGRDLTRSKLIDALNHIHDLDTGVLSAPISFSPDNHAGVQGGSFLTYEGGKLIVLHTFQPKQS